MWRCNALLLLWLVSWAGVASAQDGMVTHSLTVSIHPAANPKVTQDEIEKILKGASDILQGHTTITPHNNCKVEFKLKGLVTWTSGPADITDDIDLEQVQEVPADVKVVQSITYCAQEHNNGGYAGCAWRPKLRPRTMIVARSEFSLSMGNGPMIWAHEYGHTTGLNHRYHKGILSDSENLMTPCDLEIASQPINQFECDHFLKGPVSNYPRTLGPRCPQSSSTGHPPD
jgi:hypothetical protein